MNYLLWRWLIVSASLYGACVSAGALGLGLHMDPERPWRLAIAAVAIGLINAVIVPILRLMTFPLHCLTLGLSTIVINALLFFWVGRQGLGIVVDDFLGALFGVVCVSLISALLSFLAPDRKRRHEER
jgi:putative membrane protein